MKPTRRAVRIRKSFAWIIVFTLAFQSLGALPVWANQSAPQGGPHEAVPHTGRLNPESSPISDCEKLAETLRNDWKPARDPVLLTGGKLFIPITDVEIPGPGRATGLNLKLVRNFSSQDSFDGVFGRGWVSNLDVTAYLRMNFFQSAGLIVLAGSTISFRDEDGSLLSFVLPQNESVDGRRITFTDGQRKIVWTPDMSDPQRKGRFRYVKPHGTAYNLVHNSFIRMESIEDRNGNKIHYHYDAHGRVVRLSDDAGQSFTIGYYIYQNSPWFIGRYVVNITDPAGRIWKYYYGEGAGEARPALREMIDPLNRVTQYAYQQTDTPGSNLTSIVDPMNFVTRYNYNVPDSVRSMTKPDGTRLQFSYDRLLGTSQMIDEEGRPWNFEYVKIGLGTKVVDPDGGVWSYKYDPLTNLTTEFRDPLGRLTQYLYDADQNLIKIHDPAGFEELFSYDSNYNQWLTHTDKEGRKTERELDNEGNVTKITDPAGNVTTLSHDEHGWLTNQVDANGNGSSFTYDTKGNILTSADALGNTTAFTYDLANRLLSVTDANSKTTTFQYDAGDRVLSVTFADASKVSMTYDNDDRLLSRTDPNGNTVTFTYNLPTWGNDVDCQSCSDSSQAAQPHPATVTDALGNKTTFTYDARGNVKIVTDANLNQTTFTYGIYDRLLTSTDANGGVTTLAYDKVGNLLKVKDAAGHDTTFEYDVLNRRTSETDALGNKTSFEYDKESNLTRRLDANGKATTYAYDPLDRLTKTLYPDATAVDFSYDPIGNVLLMKDRTGTTAYSYDKNDHIVSALMPGNKTVSYGYDAVGNVLSLASPVGKSAYTYDALNRLKTVTDPAASTTAYSYDAGGRRTKTVYSNGIEAAYAYDKADRLTSLTHSLPSNPSLLLPFFAYTYDKVGNRLSMQDFEGTHGYTYDKLYRLVTVNYPVGSGSVYTYDPVGNRLSQVTPTGTTTYSYDTANRLLAAGARSFTYDPNGNRLSEAAPNGTTTYAYDFENRLVSATIPYSKKDKKKPKTKDTTVVSFQYDGLGRRFQRSFTSKKLNTTTRFYHDGFDVLFETDGAGTLKRSYTQGARIDEVLSSTDTKALLSDGLGSTRSLTDASGQTTTSYTYDVFGELRSETGTSANNTLFTGRDLDRDLGIYYYRNRWYDPAIGRFITKDPIGLLAGEANVYSYANSNPINASDPLGLIIPGDPDPTDEILIATAVAKYVNSPAGSRLLGRAGELASGIIKNTERIASLTGARYRIPDQLDHLNEVIGEVKNVCYLSYSGQLRDFVAYSKEFGYRLVLYVRQGTQISQPLQEALDDVGAVIERSL